MRKLLTTDLVTSEAIREVFIRCQNLYKAKGEFSHWLLVIYAKNKFTQSGASTKNVQEVP
jgi:hypothetical protein